MFDDGIDTQDDDRGAAIVIGYAAMAISGFLMGLLVTYIF